MKIHEADPAGALPGWWLACAALACVTCMVLFGVAITQDSVALAFAAVLVLLLAATGLPWVLHRHQRKHESNRQ